MIHMNVHYMQILQKVELLQIIDEVMYKEYYNIKNHGNKSAFNIMRCIPHIKDL